MAFDPGRVQALCFDMDGTLRDTDDRWVENLARRLKPVSFLLPGRDTTRFSRRFVMWAENPGTYLTTLADRFQIDSGIARLSDGLYRMGFGRETQPQPVVPGIQEMLGKIHERYPMAVVSARGERFTRAFLNYLGVTPLFQAIACGQTCAHTKPYADPILWAAEKMGVEAANCLMIGDTIVDILSGRAAGAQTAGVLCGFGEEAELRQAGADLILADTPAILEYLKL
jgi:N-acetyl-D-muramate 6-phosphate phosphatase